jgi:hypothetical protein
LPKGRPAILIDDEYGAEIAIRAREAGVVVALPLEKSGRRELAFEHEPFYSALERLGADYAKILPEHGKAQWVPRRSAQVAKTVSVGRLGSDSGETTDHSLVLPRAIWLLGRPPRIRPVLD